MNRATAPQGSDQGGLPYALAAYGIWGFVPIFFKLLVSVPPVEVLAQRILWSLPLCFAIMVFRRQIGDYLAALRDWRTLRILLVSSILIALNWLVYIYAIVTDHVLATSLGYYLNPLVNVMLGMIFLGERLSRLQMVAVAIAALGVALLLGGALETLWISLTLAFSFGFYGLLRKVAPVGSLPGLAIETTLLFFATAARRMSFAVLGFCQYLAPSIVFLLGLFLFDEPLKPAQLFCFLLIWISIALFSFDIWAKSRGARVAPTP
ncbi:EamA family transporter RarD [Sphingopyxis granuli]|uniref:EamA family transporter RarD n=1 Tax=Sphingopyxis granuli TaxID=267128 RepID=UPI001F53B51B|nr:EamA family transporter RarD [Sphingopyxis granuli]UNK78844.1 EamA family transporter RarD [Sphingopyxis granuli]